MNRNKKSIKQGSIIWSCFLNAWLVSKSLLNCWSRSWSSWPPVSCAALPRKPIKATQSIMNCSSNFTFTYSASFGIKLYTFTTIFRICPVCPLAVEESNFEHIGCVTDVTSNHSAELALVYFSTAGSTDKDIRNWRTTKTNILTLPLHVHTVGQHTSSGQHLLLHLYGMMQENVSHPSRSRGCWFYT